jgi:predicted RNase H-like HicB family nuclease
MKYVVVVERSKTGFGAYVPDLPGCVATARTRARVLVLIRDAIVMHVDGLIEDGFDVPKPSAAAATVELPALRKRRKAA